MSLIHRTFLSTNMLDYGANKNIAFNSATMIDLMSGGFGATGNGSTDDTAAVNNALIAGKAAGKSIYCTNGIYMHNAKITVDASGLIGQSGNVIFRATAGETGPITDSGDHTFTGSSDRQINIIGAGPSLVRNIRLDATSTIHRFTTPSSDGIHIQGSNVLIDSVTVDGGTQAQGNFTAGIHTESYDPNGNLSNITYTNNLVINTNADRFRIASWNGHTITTVRESGNLAVSIPGGAQGDDDFSYIGNDVTTINDIIAEANVGMGPKFWGQGADFEGCVGVMFKNNQFWYNGLGHAPGIIIQVPATYPGPGTSDVEITNNYLNGCGRSSSDRGQLAALTIDMGPASNIRILFNRITRTEPTTFDLGFTGTGTKSNITCHGNVDPDGSAITVNNTYAGGIVTFY